MLKDARATSNQRNENDRLNTVRGEGIVVFLEAERVLRQTRILTDSTMERGNQRQRMAAWLFTVYTIGP